MKNISLFAGDENGNVLKILEILQNSILNSDKTERRAQFNENFKVYQDLHETDSFAEDLFLAISTVEKNYAEMKHAFKGRKIFFGDHPVRCGTLYNEKTIWYWY